MSDNAARIKELEAKVQEFERAKEAQFLALQSGNVMTQSERKVLTSFGCASLKQLLETNVCDRRFNHVNLETKLEVLNLKKQLDVARMVSQIYQGEKNFEEVLDGTQRVHAQKGLLETGYAKSFDLKNRFKAFASTAAGDGLEWVPTAVASTYIEEFELERKVAAAFRQIKIPMGSGIYEMPVMTDVTEARLSSQHIGVGAATPTDENFGTDKVPFDSKKAIEYYLLPEELTEDSAPDVLEAGRAQVLQAQLRAIENAVLNGDVTATHMDTGVASPSFQKAWNGLRKLALATGSSTIDFAAGSAAQISKLRDMRALMGKFGVNPKSLMWTVSPQAYSQLVGLDELSTLEKIGPLATILTGAAGVLYGIPVVVSEFVKENLGAAGVVTATPANNIKTAIYLTNIERFYLGQKRPIRVKVQDDSRIEFDRIQLVSYQRAAFAGHKQAGAAYASGSISKEKSSVLGINIAI
jgi:HK97 family phage major capsid protein